MIIMDMRKEGSVLIRMDIDTDPGYELRSLTVTFPTAREHSTWHCC